MFPSTWRQYAYLEVLSSMAKRIRTALAGHCPSTCGKEYMSFCLGPQRDRPKTILKGTLHSKITQRGKEIPTKQIRVEFTFVIQGSGICGQFESLERRNPMYCLPQGSYNQGTRAEYGFRKPRISHGLVHVPS